MLKFIKLMSIWLTLPMVMGCQDKIELYENPPEYLLQQVEPYYPLAIKFVRDNEQVALSKGIPLLPQYLEIARRVGVKYPEKVRVYYVEQLPLPDNESLLFQMQRFGLDSPYLAGMTYGYGIWIKKSAKGDKLLLSHELIHVKQTEELGLEEITKRYFLQLKVFGYRDAPIEIEAYDNAHKYL